MTFEHICSTRYFEPAEDDPDTPTLRSDLYVSRAARYYCWEVSRRRKCRAETFARCIVEFAIVQRIIDVSIPVIGGGSKCCR